MVDAEEIIYRRERCGDSVHAARKEWPDLLHPDL
jgi:hypothetical protein